MNEIHDLLNHHARVLKESLHFWISPGDGKEDPSQEEAAYDVLRHAGMLFRYTNDETMLQGLLDLEREQGRALVLQACAYIQGFTLAESVRDQYAADEEEPMDAEDLEQLERFVFLRDGLEEALVTAKRVVTRDLDEQDPEIVEALALAHCVSADTDSAFWEQKETCAIVSRAMEPLREHIETPIHAERQWWFGLARELDETLETMPLERLLDLQDSKQAVDPPRSPLQVEFVHDRPASAAAAGLTRLGSFVACNYALTGFGEKETDVVRLQLEGEGGAWSGFLDVPARAAPDAEIAIWLCAEDGEPVQAGELTILGYQLAVRSGRARIGLRDLADAWRNPRIRLGVSLRCEDEEWPGAIVVEDSEGDSRQS